MGFVEAVKHNFAHYADFKGRAQRSQFWWWYLFTVIVSFVLNLVDMLIGWGIGKSTYEFDINGQLTQFTSPGVGVLTLIWSLAILIPTLAVLARRLHDTDRSAWWILWGYLLAVVCCIGFIILLVFTVQRGTAGENKFGPDPLAAGG